VKDWEKFEVAVERFVAAFDPSVTVRRNVMLPDRDTGHPRQRDVWVITKVCNLFEVNILISCKKWSTRLDESDIDAFAGELRSSGAHKGVIYAEKGFTKPAIEKAQVLGISCCKLYQNESADIPDSLKLLFYICNPRYRLRVQLDRCEDWSDVIFEDVFSHLIVVDGERESVLDKLVREFQAMEARAIEEVARGRRHLHPWTLTLQFEGMSPLALVIEGKWDIYQAALEGHLLDGSYSFTEERFVGAEYSPWVDMHGTHPGPQWEHIAATADQLPKELGMIVRFHGDLRTSLVENFASKFVRDLT
jgi:hypothetical protein